MTKWAYVIIAVLIISIAAVAVAFYNTDKKQQAATNQSPQTDQSVSNQSQNYQISYSDSGFSPNQLTIKTGDSVSFTNNSSGKMWVASNPHPQHTDYPEFDALRSYDLGETFTFTFNKTGTWGFHNHFNPAATGTIKVE